MGLFKRKKETLAPGPMPRHIAIIMDGNGRWAKKRGLPRTAGHSAGASTFKTIARHGNKIGLEYMTVYAFSTENWKRPKDEVDNIINLLRDYLRDAKNFKDENIKVKFIGDMSPLDDEIKGLIKEAEDESKDATGMHLNIALNYGGRDELVHAVKSIADEYAKGDLNLNEICSQGGNIKERADGILRVGLVEEKGNVNWISKYHLNQGFFAYSCLTELSDGNFAVYYEDEPAHITYKIFSVSDKGEINEINGENFEFTGTVKTDNSLLTKIKFALGLM